MDTPTIDVARQDDASAAMIDIHILTLPTDRQDWFRQCMDSLPGGATVHIIPAKVGPIGPQRLEGFRLGQERYVTYVDPDDWCEPGVWPRVLDAMDRYVAEGYSGVCTQERGHTMTAALNGVVRSYLTPYKHHLCVMTREFIESREALFRYDMYEKDIQATPEIKQLDFVGYNWRRYISAGKRERIARDRRNRA